MRTQQQRSFKPQPVIWAVKEPATPSSSLQRPSGRATELGRHRLDPLQMRQLPVGQLAARAGRRPTIPVPPVHHLQPPLLQGPRGLLLLQLGDLLLQKPAGASLAVVRRSVMRPLQPHKRNP
jgi:hypothetical protein